MALNAKRCPSGDQAKESTLKSFFFVRCLPMTGAFSASLSTQRPEMQVAVVFANDFVVSEVFLAIL